MNCNEANRMEKVVYNNTDATNESVEMLKKALQSITDSFTDSVRKLNETLEGVVSYYDNVDTTTDCECCCNKSTPDVKSDSVKIVSWAEGNYDEIGAMLDAHYAGKINIADYWHIGDVRVEYMSEIPESNGFEHHAGHDIELVIVGFNTRILLSGKTVAVTVMVKDGLSTMGPMSVEPFSGYSRIHWLDNEFFNSLPIELNSKMNKINCVGARVILPSFNEMNQIMCTNPGLFKFTFFDAWTRDIFPIYYDHTSYISTILDKNLNLHKSYSLPFDQRNIVPMFYL